MGIDAQSAVFTHGQFYGAISQVTSVHNKGLSTSESSNKNTIHPEDFLTNFEGHHFHTTLTRNDIHVCTLRILNTFICKMSMKRL